jgi:Ca-activated chloride channel homolog
MRHWALLAHENLNQELSAALIYAEEAAEFCPMKAISSWMTILILWAGSASHVCGQTPDKSQTIRVQVEMVSLPVVVTDREGNHIKNLRAEDFSILEDGMPQDIAAFAAVEEPISVALMLDVSGSTSADLRRIQDEAIWFVSDLRNDDSIAILSVADGVNLLEQFSIYHIKDTSKIRQVKSGGLSAVYDGVQFALEKVLKLEFGRKALVFFSDGVDNRSHATREDTLELARQSDVPIYCIYFNTSSDRNRQMPRLPGVVSPPPTQMPPEYASGFEYMSDLSKYSGGLLLNASHMGNLGAAFKQIIEELSSVYSIGYYPKNAARDGKYREVQVRLSRPGMYARTRPGYYHR